MMAETRQTSYRKSLARPLKLKPPHLDRATPYQPKADLKRVSSHGAFHGWVTVKPRRARVYPVQLYWDGFSPSGSKCWYIKLSDGRSIEATDADFARWHQKLKVRAARGSGLPPARLPLVNFYAGWPRGARRKAN